jgi:predicted  nucleic acid-binding Zn-ribbon protein
MCSVQDMENQKKKIAKATEQVAPLIRAAEKLRAKAVELREQALTATRSAQSLNALADMADRAASQLEKQAAAHIQKAAELDCTPPAVVGGRF